MSYSATEYRQRLEEFVWLLVPMAQTGSDLIGLGEVIDALSGFACDGGAHEVAITVSLTLGFRAKDGGVESGALYTVRVSDEGIEFDVTETYYESGIGSDNSSRSMGSIGWNGSVDGEPMDWFRGAKDLIGDDAEFSVSRDHV
ncbi:hypothetical protein G3576_30795 [Roseomonas stagni]|uniref:Uncharacterized protein n=1 Tax=Falsiroseomonas algicola TaxID=2716930 RepID=A0A6M1LV69_9PROT|nr:hypothetical protein [Falsiroseomonas algicola]NGM24405.1 hypothetical protein [Falsiroseomonas algicola]